MYRLEHENVKGVFEKLYFRGLKRNSPLGCNKQKKKTRGEFKPPKYKERKSGVNVMQHRFLKLGTKHVKKRDSLDCLAVGVMSYNAETWP